MPNDVDQEIVLLLGRDIVVLALTVGHVHGGEV